MINIVVPPEQIVDTVELFHFKHQARKHRDTHTLAPCSLARSQARCHSLFPCLPLSHTPPLSPHTLSLPYPLLTPLVSPLPHTRTLSPTRRPLLTPLVSPTPLPPSASSPSSSWPPTSSAWASSRACTTPSKTHAPRCCCTGEGWMREWQQTRRCTHVYPILWSDHNQSYDLHLLPMPSHLSLSLRCLQEVPIPGGAWGVGGDAPGDVSVREGARVGPRAVGRGSHAAAAEGGGGAGRAGGACGVMDEEGRATWLHVGL